MKIAYVVKRYPRFSETFIVNEILAHEAAGTALEIVSLLPPVDTHFQETLARVKAPVTYLHHADAAKSAFLWSELRNLGAVEASVWTACARAGDASARELAQALALSRHIRARGITHLHAHFASSATTVARLASLITGVPYSFTAHAKDIFHESVSPADLRQKAEDAALIVTVSDFNLGFLRDLLGDCATPLRRLYNGIELDRFPFQTPTARRRTIVAVGRLVEKKGFHVLLDACGLLRKAGVEFDCVIAGGGDEEIRLRRQTETLTLGASVRFTGALPQSEIARLVQSAAVMAAPCIVAADGNRDGLPTVLLEAIALGTPCVSTDVTGIPEVIRPGQTGLLVPQNDATALAGALRRLLDDQSLRVELADAARALIEREFDSTQNAARQRALWRGAARLEVVTCE